MRREAQIYALPINHDSPLLDAPQMPAKKAQFETEFFPAGVAEYELHYNPGIDFLRMLKWCTEAPSEKFNAVFAAYSRNPIAILLGAAAIEGYANYAGQKVCLDWKEVIKCNRSFSEKLKHLFSSAKKEARLSRRPYQQTMALIKFRGHLAHPRFHHEKAVRRGPLPMLFDHIDADYPAAKVFKITTTFKNSLLKDLDLEDAPWRQSFASRPDLESSSKSPRKN
jgi:hypothetical protein